MMPAGQDETYQADRLGLQLLERVSVTPEGIT